MSLFGNIETSKTNNLFNQGNFNHLDNNNSHCYNKIANSNSKFVEQQCLFGNSIQNTNNLFNNSAHNNLDKHRNCFCKPENSKNMSFIPQQYFPKNQYLDKSNPFSSSNPSLFNNGMILEIIENNSEIISKIDKNKELFCKKPFNELRYINMSDIDDL
jgi:hypothetical protein